MDTLKPETPEQVLNAVQQAAASETPLEVRGLGAKAALGRAANTGHVLDLSGLSDIILYDAEELVLEAGAGAPLAEIETMLRGKNQMLAFEPPDLTALLNGRAYARSDGAAGTLGGMTACGFSGPRRVRAGGVRDHLLGFEAVSGRAEVFKSGGRVMKNVTGFDLSKLMTGSFGTLGVMTSVILKVLPAPEKTRTVLMMGQTPEQSVEAMTAALNSPHEVSAAAHLSKAQAARSGVDMVRAQGASVTALRVEGPEPSVEARTGALKTLLSATGPAEELHTERSSAFWREVRDVAPFTGPDFKDDLVWRISVPPAEGARTAARLDEVTDGETLFDWGGGLLWRRMAAREDAAHEQIRAALITSGGASGGHATLIKAPARIRAAVPVFHPEDAGAAAIAQRIKEGFDPKGILNPGRMAAHPHARGA
ncbi:MAG: glycolate oxidase subunit GlcE [Rhodospirillales bacterium]